MCRSWYLFMKRAVKHAVVILDAHHFVNYVQNVIQYPAVKVNSICKGNYWESSVWTSKQ